MVMRQDVLTTQDVTSVKHGSSVQVDMVHTVLDANK